MADYVPGTPVSQNGFGGNSNGGSGYNNQRPSISTSLLSMWDGSGNGMKFNVSALDSGLSIGFWVPFIGPDGRRSYPKEHRYLTILSQKNCVALEDLIVNHLLIDYDNQKNCRYGIFTNNARSTFFELEVREGEFFANLYVGCDATTHIPQNTLRFKFESIAYNSNFNPSTGEYDNIVINVDLFLFLKTVQGYNKLCSGLVSGHGWKTGNASENGRLMSYIQAIANAVHAQLPAPTYQTGFVPQPTGPTPTNPTPSMQEVTNIADLIG